jgi:hypothetical protein
MSWHVAVFASPRTGRPEQGSQEAENLARYNFELARDSVKNLAPFRWGRKSRFPEREGHYLQSGLV